MFIKKIVTHDAQKDVSLRKYNRSINLRDPGGGGGKYYPHPYYIGHRPF